MASRKRWNDHSKRWQREQANRGLSPSRWNKWIRLSPQTRKKTSPIDYAQGVSVATQYRRKQLRDAFTRMLKAVPFASDHTVRRGLAMQTADELRFTIHATGHAIQERARNPRYVRIDANGTARNPWWYR